MFNLINDKTYLLRSITLCFLLAGIAMSKDLWYTNRAFPMLPVVNHFVLSILSQLVQFPVIFVLLTLNIFISNRSLSLTVIVILSIAMINDQMRIQPWVFHYYILLLLCLIDKKNRDVSSFLNPITAGIYLWAGIFKLNPIFLDHIFPQISSAFNLPNLASLGFVVPFLEILIGLSILIGYYRRFTFGVICVMHGFIIYFLLFSRIDIDNTVIIPWNIAMVVFSYFGLFHGRQHWIIPFKKLNIKTLIVVLFVLLPFANLFNYYHYSLSFNLYSGRGGYYYIALEESIKSEEMNKIRKHKKQIEGLEGGDLISINKWSIDALNVPFPPGDRLTRQLADSICSEWMETEKIVFIKANNLYENKLIYSYTCKDLKDAIEY